MTPGAVRKRRERERRDLGLGTVAFDIERARAVAALQRRDGLTEQEADALTWAEIHQELIGVYEAWLRRWT